jgi:hypothetical protein
METVYLVIRDTYGAWSMPKGIWQEYGDAIKQAKRLAPDGEEYEELSDGFNALGAVRGDIKSWEVYEYKIGSFHKPALDYSDNGPNAPVR